MTTKTSAQIRYAKESAKVHKAWDALGGKFVYDASRRAHEESQFVRLSIVPDDSGMSFEDLTGDTFNAEAHPDIPQERMDRERKEEMDRINREGVYGVVGEYWNGEEWEHVDSCWGFVGDDWKESGYDVDIMSATIKAYQGRKHCKTCGRPERKG